MLHTCPFFVFILVSVCDMIVATTRGSRLHIVTMILKTVGPFDRRAFLIFSFH